MFFASFELLLSLDNSFDVQHRGLSESHIRWSGLKSVALRWLDLQLIMKDNFRWFKEAKSLVDDLNLKRGIVRCRVTLLLRSVEIKPLFRDFPLCFCSVSCCYY